MKRHNAESGARNAVLVVNTRSRSGRSLYRRAVALLTRRGVTLTEAHAVSDPDALPGVVREVIARGARRVIIGGGDGTISSVVGAFAYRDVVLGLLPLGTGNTFARTLGIPSKLEDAVEVILHGQVTGVDLGQVGEAYFANNADIGVSADMARSTSSGLKRFLGKLAYVLVGAAVVTQHRSFLCRVRTEDGQTTFPTHEMIIANGRFFGVTLLDADASVHNRTFTVCIMQTLSRWELFMLWAHFLLGHPSAFRTIRCFAAHDLWVDADPPQEIDVDGETRLHTPAHFRVAPDALKALIPRPAM